MRHYTEEQKERRREDGRRYYQEHREEKLAKMRDYRRRKKLSDKDFEGLTAQQKWRLLHKEEYNARRREQRAEERRLGIERRGSSLGKNKADVKPGRLCTDCSMYLRSALCSESFFRVVSCGISVAETCIHYDGPEPEPVATPEPELRVPEPVDEADRHRLVALNFIDRQSCKPCTE